MSGRVRAGSKELRALARELRAGIRLVPDGKAKVRLVDADGEPIRYPDGRIVGMPNSPGHASVRTLRARLLALDLLEPRRRR